MYRDDDDDEDDGNIKKLENVVPWILAQLLRMFQTAFSISSISVFT